MGTLGARHLLRRAAGDNSPAIHTPVRPDVYHIVGRLYQVHIVLNNQHRVPLVGKRLQNFNEFLETFSSRKRKNLRKERIRVQEQGLKLQRKVSNDIADSDWMTFYHFYHDTYLKRSGRQGYLNQAFFKMLAEQLSDSIMMVTAEKSGNMVAGALFFFDEQTLYGRYWGCQEEHEFLHFETCYYQGIEFAIERGLKRFDPGAQGEHKIQRGFTPRITYSNHFVAQPDFAKAIGNFLKEERAQIESYCLNAKSFLPFKQRDN